MIHHKVCGQSVLTDVTNLFSIQTRIGMFSKTGMVVSGVRLEIKNKMQADPKFVCTKCKNYDLKLYDLFILCRACGKKIAIEDAVYCSSIDATVCKNPDCVKALRDAKYEPLKDFLTTISFGGQ